MPHCVIVSMIIQISASLKIYPIHFYLIVSGYVVHLLMVLFIIVWYSSSDYTYGVFID